MDHKLIKLLPETDIKKTEQILTQTQQTILFTSSNKSSLGLVKKYISNQISASQIISINPDETDSIKIDQARHILELSANKQLKTRYFMINDAEKMTVATQNALLKLFEEPNDNNVFMLFSTNTRKILPTVLSRSTKVKLHKISAKSIKEVLSPEFKKSTPAELAQVQFIAGDNLDLWLKMLNDSKFFKSQIQLATLAKTLMTARNLYEKIKTIKQLPKNRIEVKEFLNLLLKMYENLYRKTHKNEYLIAMQKYSKALNKISRNAHIQLALLESML